jgi:hypothetical protein
MNPIEFTTYVTEIPYNPRNENAKGLLAPLVRSMGHILFLLAVVSSETEAGPVICTPEEKQNELNHAKDHLPPLVDIENSPILSSVAKLNILTYASAIDYLKNDWAGWEHDDQVTTLRAAANAAAALAAFLDRELAGFRTDQSDPGFSL